jgi:hypothetical protein
VGLDAGSVCGAGPGSGLSEEPTSGVRSVTLDCRVVPECPPGSAPSVGACLLASVTLKAGTFPVPLQRSVSGRRPMGGSHQGEGVAAARRCGCSPTRRPRLVSNGGLERDLARLGGAGKCVIRPELRAVVARGHARRFGPLPR